MIKSYLYRRPSYLAPNDIEKLDTIVIHHTGNNNSIDTNTDYHIDENGWNWLGYGYYIHNGEVLKVRGYKYQNAAVLGNNHNTVNIAIQGNYDRGIPSQADIEAAQLCINEIKREVPTIKFLKGHKDFNDTSCPGKLFPLKALKLNKDEYVKMEDFEKLTREMLHLNNSLDRILEVLKKNRIR